MKRIDVVRCHRRHSARRRDERGSDFSPRPAPASQRRDSDSPPGISGAAALASVATSVWQASTQTTTSRSASAALNSATFSLTELRTVRGKLSLPIERDTHFDADKTLSAYADEARTRGHIVT